MTSRDSVPPLVIGGIASLGAGAVHAAAIGGHEGLQVLMLLFAALALSQIATGVIAMVRPGPRMSAAVLVGVNAVAVAAWLITRTVGIDWIDGLAQPEGIGITDGVAAALATLAVVVGAVTLVGPRRLVRPVPVTGIGALVLVAVAGALVATTSHSHAAGDHHGAGDTGHEHADGVAHAAGDGDGTAHAHSDLADVLGEHGHDDDHAHDEAHADSTPSWPRPWDPGGPIDFSGVDGVTAAQQARAEQLVAATLATLPRFGDVTTIGELGFRSIGDSGTGHEHYINAGYIMDEHILDPAYPESLVYAVDGDDRTLVSAMFIVRDRSVDDPEIVDFGGPLMQWHVHDNLCWAMGDSGVPVVRAVTDNHGGVCPPGTVLAGGDNPMVHVWIAPHLCGPFAALEGHGAGQVAADAAVRADQCDHDHGHAHDAGDTAGDPPRPYDPALPIDLGGIEGVTDEQQAFAENLVAVTLRYLPQWDDPAVAEAAGFSSIGDAATGHEHYINWAWIDDDIWLDPNAPESLVYEVSPDGRRTLVSAMYMLPSSIPLTEVPDWGGRLMQWHIHDDLCFTADDEAPRVAQVTTVGGECRPPFVKLDPSPMIHVWIAPHRCGPFSALEGVGAGQVAAGETHFCNHVHGAD